jgi:nucleotide-binding universal stress UspA family protein
MGTKIIALVDFSRYSGTLVSLASYWCRLLGAELVVVHQIAGTAPAMADLESRRLILEAERQEALSRLRSLAEQEGGGNVKTTYHVSEESLLLVLPRLIARHGHALVLMGLKGTGALRKLFIGSTASKVIEELNEITVAIPLKARQTPPGKLIIALSYRYPLNEAGFDGLLHIFHGTIREIEFITIVTPDDDEAKATGYLGRLNGRYRDRLHSSLSIFRSADAFEQVSSYVRENEGSILVVQKGSRSLTDHLFRRFFINDLVHQGAVPLIVIPE